MEAEPQHGRQALATGIPVAVVVALHSAVSTAIIGVVDPDVPDLVRYWLIAVLGPSLLWALLVIGRAVAWRRPSAFWLGASGGIVVLASFLTAVTVVVVGVPSVLRGIPLALIISSWVLLGCALLVTLALRMAGLHADDPIDVERAPAPSPTGGEPSEAPPASTAPAEAR